MVFRTLFIGPDILWDFDVLHFLAGIIFVEIKSIFWYFYFRDTENIGLQFDNKYGIFF